MKDVLDDLERWIAEGKRFAIARVVEVSGSGPREPGATMAVTEGSEVAGSVSGGCVEGAVVTEALDVLATGQGRTQRFGYSDEQAFAVGLTCGGTIGLFIEPFVDDALLRRRLRDDEPVATATVIEGPNTGSTVVVAPGEEACGTLGEAELDRVVARDALAELEAGRTGTRSYGPHGEARQSEVHVFIHSYAPPPRMVIFGAVDFTAALVRAAKLMGYHVTVCDARPVFATPIRFPEADEVVVDWPDRYLEKVGPRLGPTDAICILTHDHKFDVPAVAAALATRAAYIGAMGSRRTQAERRDLLKEQGVTDDALARVMGPIGLDIGSRTPEETAISILAEIIALRTGREGRPLKDATGPIHVRS